MNIIITGASGGIGFHTAKALGYSSVNKIIVIARRKDKLEKLAGESSHGNIYPIVFDLEKGIYSELLFEIKEIFKLDEGIKIDVLINNAGFLVNKPFMNIEEWEWQKIFNVNLFANITLIKMLYHFFNKKNGSHIVNIASMGGIEGSAKFKGLSAYSASKAALNNLTESLALEFINDNIHVNSINPGAVQTPMLEQAFPNFAAKVSPEQMGDFVANFAINNGQIMNGRIVQVSLES